MIKLYLNKISNHFTVFIDYYTFSNLSIKTTNIIISNQNIYRNITLFCIQMYIVLSHKTVEKLIFSIYTFYKYKEGMKNEKN